jgi:6-phosphofructokinase 2
VTDQQHIATVTLSPAIDLSCSTERVVPDRKLRCSDVARAPGGGGLNVTRAIHKLGGAATALWSMGGVTGLLLRQLLDDEQLHHTPVAVVADTRENLTAHERSTNQQYRFTMPGQRLEADEVARWQQVIHELSPSPDYLVLSGSLPEGVGADFYGALRDAAPKGARIVLDTSGAALQKSVARGGLYLVKPNLPELEQLTGRSLSGEADIEAAARSLVDEGRVQVVLASLGQGGALLASDAGVTRIGAPTVRIKSRVGAGDSTVAGFVLGLARGLALSDAGRFAVACGAAAVMTQGTDLCRREDAELLYEEMTRRG